MNIKQIASNDKAQWIARTAVFAALAVTFQALSAPLGQFVAGSLVNLVLILAAVLGGLGCGIVVGCITPIFALVLGIMAIPPVAPLVAVGNVSIVLVWYFISQKIKIGKPVVRNAVAAVIGALVKFGVLYVCVVVLLVPALKFPDPQLAKITAMFSYPQLITASIGGAVATAILPVLSKVLKRPVPEKTAAQEV